MSIFGVNGLILRVLSHFSLHMPILLAAICLMAAAALMGVIYKTVRVYGYQSVVDPPKAKQRNPGEAVAKPGIIKGRKGISLKT